MPRGEWRAARSGGFTYIGLLALIVLIGLMLAGAGEVSRTAAQREREQQLLWVGHQYRDAIGRFVAHNHHYPATLAELLGPTSLNSDSSSPGATDTPAVAPNVLGALNFRALRRLYGDPMTNSDDWVTIPSPDGRIMGVASASTREPIKRAGFDEEDAAFEKADTYAGWQFVYQPPAYARWRLSVPAPAN